jgi:hypothetical protein
VGRRSETFNITRFPVALYRLFTSCWPWWFSYWNRGISPPWVPSDGIKGEANTGTRDPNLITEDIPIVPRKGLNISITIEVMGGIIITKDDGSPRLSR